MVVSAIFIMCGLSTSDGLHLCSKYGHIRQKNDFEQFQPITCWTCANQSSNGACNDWAPDVQCPVEYSVCKSVHHVNVITMETESVTKSCSAATACDVGCRDAAGDDVMECVSCCTGSYCNEDIPRDSLSAIALSVTSFTSECSLVGVSQYLMIWTSVFYIIMQ